MSDPRTLLLRSLLPRLDVSRFRAEKAYASEVERFVTDLGVGGFVLFDGDVEEIPPLVERLASIAPAPLLVAADCEHGVTMRFRGGTAFPSMRALGEGGDVATTYTVARSIAREMRALGIVWNFAPVADVNADPDNPIINIRSFGEEPSLVADHVAAYLHGLQDGGVAACAKHFPGHGDTSVDSHLALPKLDLDRGRLEAVELLPFRRAISEGVRSIMTAHLSVPALDSSESPASLSRPIVTGLLREEMGFDGVIVTDALDMGGIAPSGEKGSEVVAAFRAGNDILEIPADVDAAAAALIRALEEGEIEAEQVEASAARVERLRRWTEGHEDAGFGDLDLVRRGHHAVALEAARRAMRTQGRLRRLYPPLLVVAVVDGEGATPAAEWFEFFSSWYQGEATGAVVTPDVTEAEHSELADAIEGSGTVIVPLFVRPRGGSGGVGLTELQLDIVRCAFERPAALLNFGNPYLLREREPAVRIDLFSSCTASLAASIEGLASVTEQ